MSRKNPHIVRKIQKFIYQRAEHLSFRSAHLTFWSKITLFWIFITFLSLFLPWVNSLDGIMSTSQNKLDSFSSFSWYIGHVWFLILCILTLSAFSIFSIVRKEKIRFFMLIQISDTLCCLCSSVIIFILSIQSYFFINWLQLFSANILYGKWIILSITGALIIFTWSIIMRNEYRKNIKGSYISEIDKKIQDLQIDEQKDNMKLPF